MTISSHPLREHLEAVNHREAWQHMKQLAAEVNPITEEDIKQLHSILMRVILSQEAGFYRTEHVSIAGSSYATPTPYEVSILMQGLVMEINDCTEHPVLHAIRMHHQFVAIHPFIDGNGRTGRLLMNLLLIRAGYPAALIQTEQRNTYYQALQEAGGGNIIPLQRYICDCVLASLHNRLSFYD